MIRMYADKRINKYYKIALSLSIVSLVIAILSVIAHACATFLRVPTHTIDSTQIFYLSLFYLLIIMIPISVLSCSAISLKPIKQNAGKTIKETKWRNDVTKVLFPIIFSFTPYVSLCASFFQFLISLCFGNFDTSGLVVCASMCGYVFPSHVFVYIADIFLKNSCVLIQREWVNDPPEFIKQELIKKAKRQEEKTKQRTEQAQQKAEMQKQRNDTQCRVLLQKCGMRFFIKYYRQIKTLPLRDIILSETYSPEEKDERLNAAKKIIDLNLSNSALNTIIDVYGNSLQSEEIEQAEELLAEVVSDQNSEDDKPCAKEHTTRLYDPYDE